MTHFVASKLQLFGVLRTESFAWCGIVLILFSLSVIPIAAQEEFTSPASWSAPDASNVRKHLDTWLSSITLTEEQERSIELLWNEPTSTQVDLLERTVASFAIADQQLAQLLILGRSPDPVQVHAAASEGIWLQKDYPRFVKNNIQLWLGRALAVQELYPEALVQLKDLNAAEVVDPAILLFYRSVAEYRARQKDAGLESIAQLLENRAAIPTRYQKIAEMMKQDLQEFQEDSLDDVARLMDSVRVGLNHGRAGAIVRAEEEEVVTKLQKMIDELEQQRQQQQQQSSGGNANGNQSLQPAQQSQLAGGQGQGDVDKKNHDDDAHWGNLPPKEREEALQQLGKEFPAHYREVIEGYFRSLAKD